jgi:hypothetical protein
MHLLGYRENYWNSKIMVEPGELYLLSKQFQCHEVKFHQLTIGTLLKIVKCVKHEGFVFYTNNGISAKIKSPYYLTSKWLARNLKIDKIMRDDFKQQIDEEYYPLLSAIRDNINEYTAKTEQERLAWVRKFLE